jgi:hypothetical protein
VTTAAQKRAAKRARRPIYMIVRRLMDPETGELVGALVPSHPVDQRLMKDRKFHVNREVRADLKAPRIVWQHRLLHKIGQLLVDEVEEFRDLSSHEAIKRVQRASGVCCDEHEIPGTGITIREAQSLAFDEMESDEFEHLFVGVTQYIGDHYAHVMLDEVRAEFWSMANRETQR